jgi:hypothetical protein
LGRQKIFRRPEPPLAPIPLALGKAARFQPCEPVIQGGRFAPEQRGVSVRHDRTALSAEDAQRISVCTR